MRKRQLRAGTLFVIACFTSPCCTPLIVPLVLVLLAGTPLAAWLGHNLGWVYGILTLVSALSFVVSVCWWHTRTSDQPYTIRPSDIFVVTGDQPHVQQ